MPITLETWNAASLQPVEYPDEARTEAGTLGNSLTLARGTVLGKRTSDNKLYAYNDALTDGTNVAVGILKFDVKTDANGYHFLGTDTTASSFNVPQRGTTYYIAGTFDTTELTGWDAAAATDLHARTLASGYVRIP